MDNLVIAYHYPRHPYLCVFTASPRSRRVQTVKRKDNGRVYASLTLVKLWQALRELGLGNTDADVDAVEVLLGESDAQFLTRLRPKVVPEDAIAVLDTLRSKLPLDRIIERHNKNKNLFRTAWEIIGGRVVVNEAKAREEWLADLRETRNRLLIATDADSVKLGEVGSEKDKKDLKDKRQLWRDLPTTQSPIIASLTLDQLASHWPFTAEDDAKARAHEIPFTGNPSTAPLLRRP